MTIDKEELTRPFDASQIRQRSGGKAGKDFDYVPVGDVLDRLVTATENDFQWTLKRCELFYTGTTPAFWLVEGTLTIPELGSRDGVGTHQALDLESPKSAESDALKRAAVKFGVALELYQKTTKPAAQAQGATAQAHVPSTANPTGRTGSVTAPHVRPDINASGHKCPTCNAPDGKEHAKTCTHAYDSLKKKAEAQAA